LGADGSFGRNSFTMEGDETFELTHAEREELDRRLKDYEENPSEAVSWDELKRRLNESRYKGI